MPTKRWVQRPLMAWVQAPLLASDEPTQNRQSGNDHIVAIAGQGCPTRPAKTSDTVTSHVKARRHINGAKREG